MPSAEQIERYQNTQMSMLDRTERYEDLGTLGNFEFECRDCKETTAFHAACTGKSFLSRHRGHHTWLTNLGRTNPLVRY